MCVDALAARLGTGFSRLESQALLAKGEHQGMRLILAKPQTFMNLSGRAVGALLHYYKVPLDHLLVAYDDVDLPFGSLRLRPDGGSAGQKGMLSIIDRLGTQQFPRLRLGIGRPPGRMDAASYVLHNFQRSEAKQLAAMLERASEATLVFVTQGLVTAMNIYNVNPSE
jgi:PTH1 family peptidyl-tRNA hydrolase